jgi:hypothetical protein
MGERKILDTHLSHGESCSGLATFFGYVAGGVSICNHISLDRLSDLAVH